MGFNISGIVINKNFKNQTEELSKILNQNLQFEKEIDVETASENWKEKGRTNIETNKMLLNSLKTIQNSRTKKVRNTKKWWKFWK